jgi:hypothetical protein
MPEIIPKIKKYSFLKKGIINLVLFCASVVSVIAIILYNVKVTGIETAGALIVAEPFKFILMSFVSGMVEIFTLKGVSVYH